jgi:hypothetical protein
MITLNNKYPKILTHSDIFKTANFFGSSHYVINNDLQLFPNRCPHRGNKIINPGNIPTRLNVLGRTKGLLAKHKFKRIDILLLVEINISD